MIVVLVYRPEAADGDASDPFDGVEIYGVYLEAETRAVTAMIDDLIQQHPNWKFLVSTEKLKVGFSETLNPTRKVEKK